MIILKTKTEFFVPVSRKFESKIVYLKIDNLNIFENYIILNGYYFYYDADNQPVILDRISTSPILFSDITNFESNGLDALPNSLKEAIIQRTIELTFIRLEQENGENYGTNVSDWELIN